MFRGLPNTEAGLTPIVAQGEAFQLSNTANSSNVRITGYGVDGPAPDFGNPPLWNNDNQTQQTHFGTLTDHSVSGANSATLIDYHLQRNRSLCIPEKPISGRGHDQKSVG